MSYNTRSSYTVGAPSTTIAIPFPYQLKADVNLVIGGVPLNGADAVWADPSTITVPTMSGGTVVKRQRTTLGTEMRAVLQPGNYNASSINSALTQLLYLQQEGQDRMDILEDNDGVILDELAASVAAAAASASSANTSKNLAAASATAASGYKDLTAADASNSLAARIAAEAARDATLAAYDNFDDRYLGAKASDPAVDNDGDPLTAGRLYFNTVSAAMMIYTGSAWVAAYVSGTSFLAKAGDAMLGPLTLAGAPTLALHAAPKNYVDQKISDVVNSSPALLDTLSELASAIGNDPNFATTVLNAIALKAPTNSPTFTGDPKAPTPSPGDRDTSVATTAYVQEALAGQEVTASPSADTNNLSGVDALGSEVTLILTPTASFNLTGVVPGNCRRLNVINGTSGASGRLVVLPHESGNSTAANRFSMPDMMPRFLAPGDIFTFVRAGSRWVPTGSASWTQSFPVWGDMVANSTPWIGSFSGTGAAGGAALNSYLATDTTQKPQGTFKLDTGTTNTGATHNGLYGGSQLNPAQGPGLVVGRLAVPLLSTVSEEFALRFGFHDNMATDSDVTDGVYWEYLRTASVNWSMNCAGGGTRSKTASGVAVDTNYVWLGIFVNSDWSRADFFISQDGRTWTFAGSQSGANMPIASETTGFGVVLRKSAGTTSRTAEVDLMAYRYDTYRGAA
ncbi:hypothetical protein [Taklimakanibacter albus]|uniref:Uncharacterized protein n=1 Tax=Taklimakanibacter albus TaxID=2800327 RepID=A0ACC5RG74_9HYPH|nr:hypothetical protein [Aestuariivirga sp. YIM B02566]MBK1871578.1 hypothetical protein [Aestuariivirga sp. YIM B02566]